MPYWRLHYHFIWTTFERTPWLTEHLAQVVYRSICARATRLAVIVREIGGIEDHVHVVASVPPKLAVAECVGQLKGASSHTANDSLGVTSPFRWQSGYGALSLGERSLPSVIAYVRDQRAHHASASLMPLYEQTGEDDQATAAAADGRARQRPV